MTDIEMARVAGGALMLADLRGAPPREVRLESFSLGVYAVTEEQLAEVLGIAVRAPRRPAVSVSWIRAVRFCNALSDWEGLDAAYRVDGDEVTWHVDADGYRLPTEAEWEFACRAGSTGPHYGPLRDIAWTEADGFSTPRDVGGKLPNLNGLFDMLGNVWEWCWDAFDPFRYGDARVFRGGGVQDAAFSVTAAERRGASPASTHRDVGLRVARGGFDGGDAAQGWSAAADRARAIGEDPWTRRRPRR